MEKLIDTDALEGGEFHDVESWTPIEASSWRRGWNDAIDAIISNVSTVDSPEVVRCKDCYYCAQEKSFGKVYHYCEAFEQHAEGDLIGVSLQVNPDHFCSWGERREDDKRGME